MRARVGLHEDHDRLVLLPTDGDDLGLRRALRDCGFDPGPSRLEGVTVQAARAVDLLRLSPDLDGELLWDAAARRFAWNREEAALLQPRLLERVRWARAATREEASAQLTDLHAVAALDDHQVANVAVMTAPECYGLCLFDEQGAGKTISAVFAWDLLSHRNELDRVLIVAPKSMTAEWARDLERFRPGLYSVAVLQGSRRAKARTVRRGADVVVTGFESAVSLEEILRTWASARRTLLIVDESFHVKNPASLRSGAVRRLRESCSRAFILCGTPAPNSPHDIAAQVDLADLGVAFAGVEIPEDREAAGPVVRRVVEERAAYMRSLKRDVLPELTAKRLSVVPLEMAPRQNELYEALRGELVVELQGIDEPEFQRRRASFAARRSALLQVCSHPAGVAADYTEEPTKLSALQRLVNDLVACGEKVVVWSFYRASLERVVAALKDFGVVRYDGSVTSVHARRDAVQRFQSDPATRVFVGNPAAAGAGLTLHAARYAVYESFSGQAAHYLQSLDRVHRRGQERDVEILVLLCRDTIEEHEFERLRTKEAAAGRLMGDGAEPSLTRESLLEELTP